MKFTINRDHFSAGLSRVLNVVGSKITMPILSSVLIRAEAGSVSLTTTNLDMGVFCRIKADVKQTGALALPVRRLAGIVKELSAQEVSVELVGASLVKIMSGGSVFRISGLGADEFPAMPDVTKGQAAELDQNIFAEMLTSVAYAQSPDETRYILNGVLLEFTKGKLTTVATDGRRMAFHSKKVTGGPSADTKVILPARCVAELMRSLGTGEKVKVTMDVRRAVFEIGVDDESSGFIGSVRLYSKVVEGSYPNYRAVIPTKETTGNFDIERDVLLAAIKRAALVCSERNHTVKLKVAPDVLELSAETSDLGESREVVPLEYKGPEGKVAFNPTFMTDPLGSIVQDRVSIEFGDAVTPIVIKAGGDFLCVVLPVRF